MAGIWCVQMKLNYRMWQRERTLEATESSGFLTILGHKTLLSNSISLRMLMFKLKEAAQVWLRQAGDPCAPMGDMQGD